MIHFIHQTCVQRNPIILCHAFFRPMVGPHFWVQKCSPENQTEDNKYPIIHWHRSSFESDFQFRAKSVTNRNERHAIVNQIYMYFILFTIVVAPATTATTRVRVLDNETAPGRQNRKWREEPEEENREKERKKQNRKITVTDLIQTITKQQLKRQ